MAILHIEDEENDRILFAHAWNHLKGETCPISVPSAEEAMDYLRGTRRYRDRQEFPYPRLLVLDYTLPGMDGLEFMRWLKASQHRDLPVVVLSGCLKPSILNELYLAGAVMVLSKPGDFAGLRAMARSMAEFQLEMAGA